MEELKWIWMNGNEGIEMKEIEISEYEWIEMNELAWMNWNAGIEMKELKWRSEWMNERMNEWMNEWKNEGMNGWNEMNWN